MPPAAIASCRVLELGCAGGENLVAMALPLPGARFFGVDASARHIEQGRALRPRDRRRERRAPRGRTSRTCRRIFRNSTTSSATACTPGSPPRCREDSRGLRAASRPAGGRLPLLQHLPRRRILRLMAREMMRYHVRKLTDPEESTTEQARALFQMVKKLAPSAPGRTRKSSSTSGATSEQRAGLVRLPRIPGGAQPARLLLRSGRRAPPDTVSQYLANSRNAPWEHRLPPSPATFRGVGPRRPRAVPGLSR